MEVLLTIRDDGCGFDPAQVAPDSVGLHSMRERAAQIGATLHSTSQRHKGTTVAIGARGSPSRGAHDPTTPARVPTDWMALRPLGRRTGVG